MAQAQVSNDLQLGFPPKGSLKRFAFPELVREIAEHKLTGSLYLLSAQTKKVVFFDEGQPVFVRSNVLSECLGQILTHEGLITQEQCEQTLEAIRRTGKKQGELLVEMGILSEGNLRYGLEAQLRAKLFDIFSWDDGRYQFKGDPPNLQFGIKLDVSAQGVIIDAVLDQYSEERARRALEPRLEKYVVQRPGGETEGLDLLPEELYYLSCIDGSRTIKELIAQRVEPSVPTPVALIYGLLQAGLCELMDTAEPAKDRPEPPDLSPGQTSDEELAPDFEAQDVVTEYEDTPLPGELPKMRGLLGDHEDDFAGVEDEDQQSNPNLRAEVSEDLVAAEPEAEEETFDEDQIELMDDEVEIVEGAVTDDTLSAVEPDLLSGPHDLETVADGRDLDGLDEPSTIDSAEVALADDEEDLSIDLTDDEPLLVAEQEHSMPVQIPPAEEPLANPSSRQASSNPSVAPGALGDDLLSADEMDGLDLEPDADLALGGAEYERMELGEDLADIEEADIEVVEEASAAPAARADADELLSFDELDDIDLGDDAEQTDGVPPPASNSPLEQLPAQYAGQEATHDESDQNPEMVGAIRFNEAETAMSSGDHAQAVALLEDAYDNGFDVAELHAMLAYARFMASGQEMETAKHAFELLDYAQNMDPSLDLVHAYRGAIYRAIDQPQRAREALDRALELNPYCELAMEIMDSLG